MPQSFGVYGAQSHGVQPWINTLVVGKSLFNFYDSQGDMVSTAPVFIPAVQDGPGVVARYNNLTLNHTLTTTNRCRSLTVLVDGDLTINSGGGISMTARGARGSAAMGLYDGYIPISIDISSKYLRLADVLKYLRDNAIDVTDCWFWDDWSKNMGVTATFSQGGALVLLSAAGCGGGGAKMEMVGGSAGNQRTGNVGAAGTNGGTGGGGGGGASWSWGISGVGGKANPWGGGSGGGSGLPIDYSNLAVQLDADQFGGKGGDGYSSGAGDSWCSYAGAGNLQGAMYGVGYQTTWTSAQDGTGGILRVIVKGNVTINAGGVIQADGKNGGGDATRLYQYAGAGSGGGHVSIITLGNYTNNGTVRANGGTGGTYTTHGAAGGAGGTGSVVTKTFAQMGW
ncbi:MAG: hypothetical protein HY795_05840 [Desulfovibrio sp.]|nr:hypothetical protein [Desulfovibrio sp.]MBI4961354.1 hypothetical protein [Desulfovibrio sp.]